ncbi:MFS transporter [Streptomyces tailanensis]|uniref:MFS transporter n=1 Tax=Streptomyces tailanensis TaxID=2569858 RepID=UPI00122E02BB|nr:MFS transporter [Streptomyces tailanensis]
MATTTPAGVRAHAKHGGSVDGGRNGGGAPMTHRQIMEALTGLLLGMFVAILSSTIVSNALPDIIKDLGGGQSAYTWVMTASLLAMTASTPLWGKLADLFSKKLLIQLALVIFVLGSAAAGLSQNSGTLIAFRAVQGIGMGGLSSLAQIILATMISPRERGRYNGYLGATFATAMVGGPLIGGVITDTDWLGWRWCFYVGVPFAVIALIVLQRTLHLPAVRRKVKAKVDWAGAFLITAAVCLLLIWVTFAGDKYDWVSWQTYAMVGGTVALLAVFVLVEARASEPIIPLRLFRNRTITLASLASLFVGVAMFAGTIFFSQYFQLARNESPTMSGVLTIPMIAGLFVSSTVSGQVITRTGRWKAWLIAGGVLVSAGLGLLGTLRYDTAYWHVAVFMTLLGLGVGMMMQNLVLCTQNQVDPTDLGAASSVVTFFRSLGGAIGVSALGAVLSHRITHYAEDGLAELGVSGSSVGHGEIPDLDSLPAPIRTVIESSYGHGIGDVFLYAAPMALLALVFALFIKEVPLKKKGAMVLPVAEETMAAAEKTATVPPVGSGGTSIRGHVRGAENVPVPRAAVTLISLDGRQLGRSVAGADGAYAVDAPGAGSYVLIAAADGFQPQASTVVVDGEPVSYDVLLSGTSGLSGVVRTAQSALPVKDAMVVVTDVRGEVLATGNTGEEGEFGFAELVPGAVTVAVNAAGYCPRALPVEMDGTGVTRIEVDLEAGARLQGVVRTPRGALADARVTLVDAAGNVVGTATTGADGAYAFTDLNGGEYTVIAGGYPPVATALTVTGPGVDDHDIELAHPGE